MTETTTNTTTTTEQDCNCNEQNSACSIVHIHSPVTNISICSDCCEGAGNGDDGKGGDGKGGDSNPGTGNPTPPATRVEQYFYTETELASGSYNFSGVDVDSDNNIYASAARDSNSPFTLTVVKLASDGQRLKQVLLTTPDAKELDGDTELVCAANGYIYVAAAVNGGTLLVKLDSELNVEATQLSQDTLFDTIHRMLSDADSNLYLAGKQKLDTNNATPVMLKFDADLVLQDRKLLAGMPKGNMADVCWDHNGKLVWLAHMTPKVGESLGLIMRTDTSLALEATEQLAIINSPNPATYNRIVETQQQTYLVEVTPLANGPRALLRLNSEYQFTDVAELSVDANNNAAYKLIQLANGNLIYGYDDILLVLHPDGTYEHHIRMPGFILKDMTADHAGRLVAVTSTKKLFVLPDDLYLSTESLAQSKKVLSYHTLHSQLPTYTFINNEVSVTLASSQAITLTEPALTAETTTGEHTVDTIAP